MNGRKRERVELTERGPVEVWDVIGPTGALPSSR